MDHKTKQNREAKAEVQLLLAGITEERKKELIKKYQNPEKHLSSVHAQKILIGNWLNNAINMILKGATKEEMNRVMEHMVVLLGAVQYNLNVQQSYIDNDLLSLTRKYFKVNKVVVKKKNGQIVINEINEES